MPGAPFGTVPRAPAAVICNTYATPDWARGHNGHGTIVTSKRKVRSKQHTARQQDRLTRRAYSVLRQGNGLLDEHDVAVASVGSGGLVHSRHRAFHRSWRPLRIDSRVSARPPCRHRPHLRAVQASHEHGGSLRLK
eukprot:scaffold86732_cov78-Phaeocystis_antarctica.AAC.4